MLKQTLFFTNPAHLSLRNGQMVISRSGLDDVSRSIEDLGCVILEDQCIIITMPLLNALAENNTSVIFCDAKRMPSSMLMSLDSHTTQAENLKYQVEASVPIKKQAWKQLVEAKIQNQALVLEKYRGKGNILKPFYMNVKSGDADNREGAAARIYWNHLIDENFVRSRDENGINGLLNYGYTILRAATARALLGAGLMPHFGIFHRNRYNPFPLADDVMEPYRPFVDDIVMQLWKDGYIELNTKTKMNLIQVLFCDVQIGKIKHPLQIALTMTAASLVKLFSGDIKDISLPKIL